MGKQIQSVERSTVEPGRPVQRSEDKRLRGRRTAAMLALRTSFHPQLRLPKGLCVLVMGPIKFLKLILLSPIWLYLFIFGNLTTLEERLVCHIKMEF